MESKASPNHPVTAGSSNLPNASLPYQMAMGDSTATISNNQSA
jgi:hypothetical protein